MPYTYSSFRFTQKLIDEIEYQWVPDTYYFVSTSGVPKHIHQELWDTVTPFWGEVLDKVTLKAIDSRIYDLLTYLLRYGGTLVWSNLKGRPEVIDGIGVSVNYEMGTIRLVPMLNRDLIMDEVIKRLNDAKCNGNAPVPDVT